MTKSPDVREVLEAAFSIIHPNPSEDWKNWDNARVSEQRPEDHASFTLWNEWRMKTRLRFTRFLDAEAYADAALMLVPAHCRVVTMSEHLDRQGWYVKLVIHDPHEALEAVSAVSLPLAICEAALRAKGPTQ